VSALSVVILISAAACLGAWIASLVTNEHSWVDRLWSILPVIYLWVFAAFAHLSNARLDLMAGVVTVWGARLTFNLARKGGYTGLEDYRWPVLRASMSRWRFQLFNFFFVVLYQNFILVLITLPALTAYDHRQTPFGALDGVLALIFLALTFAETVADNQQWRFQSSKAAILKAGGSPPERFLTSGLFRYSRHPNYFYEQAQWWVLFLMGALAARSLLQWTVVGAVLLTLLFIGSTSFTEKISLSRYPEYAEYQRRTSAVIPWFSRR
jgi:steroid 5-alpha reductase family enzyme